LQNLEQHDEISNISLEQRPDISGVFIEFTEGEEPEDQSKQSSDTLTGNEMRSKSFNFTTSLEEHVELREHSDGFQVQGEGPGDISEIRVI